jgi:hypothetical protein
MGELIQHDSSFHLFAPAAQRKGYLITSLDDHSRYLLYARLNPKFAVPNHQDCGAKPLDTKLISRFCSSTDLWICLRCKIAPTARFAEGFESLSLSGV